MALMVLPTSSSNFTFIALTSPDEFALYDGDIGSTDTESGPVSDYLSFTNEFIVPHSTAKYAKHNRDSYMVGALARVNKNFDQLSPLAKEVAGMFNFKAVCHNPYMNNVAQLVEIVHSFEDTIRLINELEEMGLQEQPNYHKPDITVKAGQGASAVEVPRGILFHDYTYDENGVCTEANCIIPTNQNHNNINRDLAALVPTIIDKPQEEVELLCEMLVRAYDPCISCSTHYVDVTFV